MCRAKLYSAKECTAFEKLLHLTLLSTTSCTRQFRYATFQNLLYLAFPISFLLYLPVLTCYIPKRPLVGVWSPHWHRHLSYFSAHTNSSYFCQHRRTGRHFIGGRKKFAL